MTRALELALFVALTLTSACEREPVVIQPTPVAQLAEQPIPSDLLITFERTTCYGTCPSYVVTIDATGSVTWDGREFVDVRGQHTHQVSVDAVRDLLVRFNALNFSTLEDAYSIAATHLPRTYFTLRSNGHNKRVLLYWIDMRALERELGRQATSEHDETWWATCVALDQLAYAIDQTANTQRWIGDALKTRHR